MCKGLVSNYRKVGATKLEGVHVKFTPTKRGGGEICFTHAREGTKRFEVVFTLQLEVLTILEGGGGTKRFHSLKGGGVKNVVSCLEGGGGGGANKFGPVIFPFCSPPSQ